MCGLECLDSWESPLVPQYRPPRRGFNIRVLPAIIDDERIRFAWDNRKPQTNSNATAAVLEVVNLLRANRIQVTTEIKVALREAATDQWCSDEPARCPKRKSVTVAAIAPRQAPATASAPKQQPKKTRRTKGCASCAGGRAR